MTPAPTMHRALHRWLAEVVALCRPAAVHWCDGSEEERQALCQRLVDGGTFIALDPQRHPGCFLARTDASDVARAEARTFIASRRPEDAGPTNRWADPDALKATLRGLFAGCMAGRTLYVVPFAMGPLGSPFTRIGVQLTDSPYVVVHMRIMARIGRPVLDALGMDGEFIPCLHALGAPLAAGAADRPWPCAPLESKYIAHFPETREIWSFGSGYGGNALLGKKCLALRIASVLGRDEGWMAEHMLILALTSPAGRTHYIAAAFPSACGKTNLAMMTPSLPGWTVRCLGDDIAWMRIGEDGRLRALNPEAGFFGVAPGTSALTNPAALATVARDTLFTNALLTPERDVWWEGMGVPPPAHGIDWEGRAWTPDCGRRGAHANARFAAPAVNCPLLDPRWDDPAGVPISAILFGGRRAETIPLVNEALDWEHGVFLGASVASQTTAAALGQAGEVRRDPFAMLPFCGYHMGDYCRHWLAMGRRLGAQAPRIFAVNWFRTSHTGRFLWPGFGDNSRVLKWIAERLEGTAAGTATAIGTLPGPGELDLAGLDLAPGALAELLTVDRDGWRREADGIAAFQASLGDRLPAALADQLAALRRRLA